MGHYAIQFFSLLFTHFRALSLVSGMSPVALWCCIDEPIFKTHLRRAHWAVFVQMCIS